MPRQPQRDRAQFADEYAIAVLPQQPIDDAQQIAFASLWRSASRLRRKVQGKTGARGIGKRIKHREIFDISNLDDDGNILDADDQRAGRSAQGSQLWHTDSSFRQKSGQLSHTAERARHPGRTAPTPSSSTPARSYDALARRDENENRIFGSVAEHSIWHPAASRRLFR